VAEERAGRLPNGFVRVHERPGIRHGLT